MNLCIYCQKHSEVIDVPDSPIQVGKAATKESSRPPCLVIEDSPVKREKMITSEVKFLDGDPVKPMLSLGKSLATSRIVSFIFSHDPGMVCQKQPLKVKKNCSFLVDLRRISLVGLRADGNPSYDKYGGFRKKDISVTKNEDGFPEFSIVFNSEKITTDDQYVLNRIYHTKTFQDGNHCHRRIVYISDMREEIVNKVIILHYERT